MASLVHLTPLDPLFPSRLRGAKHTPASITCSGGPLEAACTVAIVGARQATPEAARFAHDLAAALAAAEVVVISGGALGIDAAAHRGALSVKGRTWAVAGTGHQRCFPAEHEGLFDTIAEGPGAMIWPFAPDFSARGGFTTRNRYLVALSDAVVVVQAAEHSGALHAAGCARTQKKPLWVVPASPWLRRFKGSVELLEAGAQPLHSVDPLLSSLGLRPQNRTEDDGGASPLPGSLPPRPAPPLSDQESATLRATAVTPRHTDAIAEDAGLSPQATAVALLTLALENVLVEGPPGFFRRRDGYNR
ncbi:MAG TPA: DNA-processing protein DprA [Polyangia bacterium]|jgi:DNA processing protein|nr:DNA-processing protein DprA [Polyangia bacterium]